MWNLRGKVWYSEEEYNELRGKLDSALTAEEFLNKQKNYAESIDRFHNSDNLLRKIENYCRTKTTFFHSLDNFISGKPSESYKIAKHILYLIDKDKKY